MSIVKEVSSWLLAGVGSVIQSIDDSEIERMIDILIDHKDFKILLIGSGRSGFVGRAFALRLMHLGFNVYVSGETITPALTVDDLVVALSGSGTTTTRFSMDPVPRIAAVPLGMIGMPTNVPRTPGFVIENVAP